MTFSLLKSKVKSSGPCKTNNQTVVVGGPRRSSQSVRKLNLGPQGGVRARAGKDLYCVSREINADDGSTIFKFSEEKPKEEETKPKAAAEKAQPAAPATEKEEEKMPTEEPAAAVEEEKPKGFGKSAAAGKVKVQPIVVVGAGRVGQALEEMGNGEDIVLRRGDPFPTDLKDRCPIVVCTRNDVLDDVIFSIPPGRWEDLVFLQNGVIQVSRARNKTTRQKERPPFLFADFPFFSSSPRPSHADSPGCRSRDFRTAPRCWRTSRSPSRGRSPRTARRI